MTPILPGWAWADYSCHRSTAVWPDCAIEDENDMTAESGTEVCYGISPSFFRPRLSNNKITPLYHSAVSDSTVLWVMSRRLPGPRRRDCLCIDESEEDHIVVVVEYLSSED
jgi:hypothetical protein